MNDCLFCKIIKKTVNSKVRYEDDLVFAFDDIAPKAPIHILILPKKHIASTNDLTESDKDILFAMFSAAKKIAIENKLTGYKLAFNTGKSAGQMIEHLHMHFLAGHSLKGVV